MPEPLVGPDEKIPNGQPDQARPVSSADVNTAPRQGLPLTHAWLRALPVPAFWAGLLIGLMLAGAYVWVAFDSGQLAAVLDGRLPSIFLRANVSALFLLGLAPMLHYYLRLWTDEHLRQLSTRFDLTIARRSPSVAALRVAGVVGGVFFLYFYLLMPSDGGVLLDPGFWDAQLISAAIYLPVLGWFVFRLIFELSWNAVHVSRIASRIETLDILDTEAVRPFLMHGVRSSMIAIALLSVASTLAIDAGNALLGSSINAAMLLLAAVLVVILPLFGVRNRIRQRKIDELSAVRRQILPLRLGVASLDDAALARLQTLLAIEQRLIDVNEWPMDRSSAGRIMLYVLLGIGSWIGSAVVERLLNPIL